MGRKVVFVESAGTKVWFLLKSKGGNEAILMRHVHMPSTRGWLLQFEMWRDSQPGFVVLVVRLLNAFFSFQNKKYEGLNVRVMKLQDAQCN